ncbi:MAG: hypothetical protein R3A12_17255 [Ignavibacteria bacterium]
MKSTDGGDTWLINSQAGPMQSLTQAEEIQEILRLLHFFNANTGLVGGSSLSANGDAIEELLTDGLTFNKIVLGSGSQSVTGFYFLNSTISYACGNTITRLFKTTDAGLTWSAVPNVSFKYIYNAVYAFQ